MTGKKNLFEIRTYDKSSREFDGLWKIISEKFIFNKILLNNTNKTNEKINEINNENMDKKNDVSIFNSYNSFNYFKYSKSFNDEITCKTSESNISNEIVIYQNNEYKIIANKYWEYGDIFAVQDRSQSNRYFIGFTYGLRYTDYNICGIIVYFDSTGAIGEKNILNNVVCTYDARNGIIDTSKTLFYKQSLIFYQVHRDTQELTLFVNLLNHQDNLQYKSTEYTHIKTNYLHKTKYDYPRFFHITEVLEQKNWIATKTTNVLIDLGSLKFVENYEKNISMFNFKTELKHDNYLLLDYYKIDSETEIDKFISKIIKTDVEETSFEGYPLKCAKCLNLTKTAIYRHNNTIMGLGNSFCAHCDMRYSESENSWICCKLTNKIDDNKDNFRTNICSCKLEPLTDYICNEQQVHSKKYSLQINYTEKKYKYPFKDVINVTPKLNLT